MPVQIPIDREKIADFCRRHHILRLSLFGSVLREDFGPDSDVDVLYVFHPDHQPGWDFSDIADELENLFGRPIDLVSEVWLPPTSRTHILADRKIIWQDARHLDLADRLIAKGEACLGMT